MYSELHFVSELQFRTVIMFVTELCLAHYSFNHKVLRTEKPCMVNGLHLSLVSVCEQGVGKEKI